MNDTKISLRQQKILELLQKNPKGLTRVELGDQLVLSKIELSKVTLIRDLNELLDIDLIQTAGVGKSTTYIYLTHQLLQFIDIDEYFSHDIDERTIFDSYDGEVLSLFSNICSKQELHELDALNANYLTNSTQLTPDIYRKELERFVIELSWKSSKIEGNTYSLLETEALIKEAKKAAGHSDDEAQMILNHKQAFDTIVENKRDFKKLSIKNILDIHQSLTDKMGVTKGIRKNQVGITGTKYRPLANTWLLEEALEKLVREINALEHPFEKALLAVSGISYIQAFGDGNKRTARLLANAILLAHDWAPLSYRNVDEVEYKQAMLLFYEQHNLYHLKRIFSEQFMFVVENYFRK